MALHDQVNEIGRRVREHFSVVPGTPAGGTVEGSSVIHRTTSFDSRAAVEFHEVVPGELYMVAIVDHESRALVVRDVLLLGYTESNLSTAIKYCLEQEKVLIQHFVPGCGCARANHSLVLAEPEADDYIDKAVDRIVYNAAIAFKAF